MPDEPSLREYFDQVAGANAKLAIAQFGDLRLAINAIMTLEGFFGTLHARLHNIGIVKQASDDAWKEMLARYNTSYRVLRDMAYALKHGTPTNPKLPRLVMRSDQIFEMPSAPNVERIWIEGTDADYKADEVISDVVNIAESWLAKIPKEAASG